MVLAVKAVKYGFIALAVGAVLFWWIRNTWNRREKMSDRELADLIERYLQGCGSAWEWGDFVDSRFRDERLERLRQMCFAAESEPPAQREASLTELVRRLRAEGDRRDVF